MKAHPNAGEGNGRYLHGMSRTPEYAVYKMMLHRCRKWKNYAGKGIKVCARWAYPKWGFVAFMADMGPRPPGGTIERKRNKGNYSPGNCVWASKKTQARNTSRNRMLKFRGKNRCIAAWAEETGISRKTIHHRLARGKSIREALTMPVRGRTACA